MTKSRLIALFAFVALIAASFTSCKPTEPETLKYQVTIQYWKTFGPMYAIDNGLTITMTNISNPEVKPGFEINYEDYLITDPEVLKYYEFSGRIEPETLTIEEGKRFYTMSFWYDEKKI